MKRPPKYCRECRSKLVVSETESFNTQTGKKLKAYICPKYPEGELERKKVYGDYMRELEQGNFYAFMPHYYNPHTYYLEKDEYDE